MSSILLSTIIYILSLSISFYLGWIYGRIKEKGNREPRTGTKGDSTNPLTLHRPKPTAGTVKGKHSRIISPSKKREASLKDLETLEL